MMYISILKYFLNSLHIFTDIFALKEMSSKDKMQSKSYFANPWLAFMLTLSYSFIQVLPHPYSFPTYSSTQERKLRCLRNEGSRTFLTSLIAIARIGTVARFFFFFFNCFQYSTCIPKHMVHIDNCLLSCPCQEVLEIYVWHDRKKKNQLCWY